MKRIFLTVLLIFAMTVCLCSCDGSSVYPLSLEHMILEDVVEKYGDIICAEGYAEEVERVMAIINDPTAKSSQITEAIETINRIKDSILNRSIIFTDSEFETLVRLALNIPAGGHVKYSDIIGVTDLDLSAREGHCITFLEDLSHFPNIVRLNISGNSIIDFTPISKLTSLQELDMSCASASATAKTDMSFLLHLSSLTSLSAESVGLTDLSFLADHRDLKVLNVAGNPITDYSGLLYCMSLTSLNVSGGSFANMSLFAVLSDLTSFILEDGTLNSLNGIEKLSLKKLDLSGTKLSDCSLIASVSSLTELDLSNTGISSAQCLAGMNISSLRISDNNLTDGAFLSALPSLTSVDISGNSLHTLFLQGNGHLMDIDASDNSLTSVTLMGNMGLLSRLDVSNNAISYLNISAASGLNELYADNNELVSGDFLNQLSYLKKLSLNGNDITNMPSLAGKPITYLSLNGLPISSLDFLKGMTSVTYIDLLDTDCVSLSGIEGLTSVKSLKIKLTNVADCSAMATLSGLTDLYVFGITDEFWATLSAIKTLETLYVTRSKITYVSINGLYSLREISIVTCRPLADLSRMYDLPALESLYLDYIDVYRPFISRFPNLRSLSIIDGNVQRVDGISELPALEYINLSENSTLNELSFNVLPSLKTLILSDCNLSASDLKMINVNMNMGTLDLSDNSIKNLKYFNFDPEDLIKLDLSDNKITDFSPIYDLNIPEVIWEGNKGKYEPPQEIDEGGAE